MIIATLSAIIAAAVVGLVVLVAVRGWGGEGRPARISLCVMAAGLTWAGPARALGQPLGLADLAFVAGLLGYLLTLHGRAVWAWADALDGQQDGRIRIDWRGFVERFWRPHHT